MNTIKVSVKDRLATITLDRGKSNAMNRELIVEFNDMLTNISNDDNIGGFQELKYMGLILFCMRPRLKTAN